SVTTGVGVEVPYYNDFTNEYAGTGASRGPKNWVTGLTNNAAPAASSTYQPYVYNTAWTTPPADVVKNSLRLYNGATNATGTTGFPYAIMPELLNADVKDLKIAFYGYYNSTSTSSTYAAKVGGPFGQLHVGVVNSPSDIDKTNQFSKVTKIATIRCKAGKAAEKFVIDFSAYAGTGKYIVFYSDTAKNNDMQIDNLTIAKTTDPWKVSEMVVSNITQTGAKLAWNENGLASQWNVKLFDAEPEDIDAATPVYSATVEAKEATFSDLKHSTQYFAYVQSTQASGVSEWVSTSFWTETGNWEVPFEENFSGYAATSSYRSLPNYYGLLQEDGSTLPAGNVYVYVYNFQGENFLKMQATTSYKVTMFTFPPFEKPVNTLEMTFLAHADAVESSTDAAKQTAIDNSPTEVGILEADGTFVPVSTFRVNSIEWEEKYVNFQSYTGAGGRIAIRCDYNKRKNTNTVRMDNFRIKEMSECGRLLGVEVTEIDSISAKLSWAKSKTETKWNLKISTSALTDPASETADFFDGQVDVQAKALDGLEGNTNYYVYIQTVDEAKSCVGDWSSATVFRTLCKLQTFPYFEDFENYATGAGNLPDCANLCGEDADHSYVYSNTTYGKRLYINQKAKEHKNYFVFPALRTDDVRKLQLNMQVWVGTTATSTYRYQVGIMTDPNDPSTFVSLHNEELMGSSNPYDRSYKFNGYQGNETGTKFGGYIAISPRDYSLANGNTNYTSMYIDNVTIDFIETCTKPIDVVADSIGSFGVKLIWKTDNKTAAHRVRLFTSPDVDPNTDAFAAEAVVNDSVAVLEGIGANTVYYAFVRKECAANDVSKWSSSYMVHTNCSPTQTMPYEEGFESGTASQAPDCWTSLLLSGSSSAKAQIVTSSNYVFSGTKAMSVNKYFSQQGTSSYITGQAAAVTPALDIESPKDVLIYFDLKSGSTTHNQVSLRIEAVSDETANADAIYITTIEDITSTWKKAYIKVADYYTSAQPYQRFRFTPQTTATNSGATVYIDNIVFTKDLNAVLPVSELKVKKVDVDSLTFTFLESTPGVKGWKVAYGPQGVALDEATIFDVDTTVVTLNGLTANTSYDIYVRSEKTEWIGPLTASTVQVPTTLPYATGWEDNDENAMWNLYNVKTVQGKFYHNFFIVGDAAKCDGIGDKALFITNDSAN
ncbi:MAG: fibronectin type III domain-containing protein, partial [Paludibacteraceae bacterium]|nr:fibronectin type III domain-containing protein [Paludibacteraceae bacterium]